jgi:hypothetical protein
MKKNHLHIFIIMIIVLYNNTIEFGTSPCTCWKVPSKHGTGAACPTVVNVPGGLGNWQEEFAPPGQ